MSHIKMIFFQQGHLVIDNQRVLEVLVVQDPIVKQDFFPGGFISGSSSKYSTMCEAFMTSVLGEEDVDGLRDGEVDEVDKDDMINFFRQYAQMDLSIAGIRSGGLIAQELYRGYVDDSRNTDNAWVEAEIWSFHYPGKDTLNKSIKDREKHWRQVAPQMQLDSSLLPYALQVMQILDISN